jgi:hypothetical protein
VVQRYNRFAERIDELGLQEDVDAKPILDVSSAVGTQTWNFNNVRW